LAIKYINLLNLPQNSKLDAYHLTTAVVFEIDFLLSWNSKHISNAIVASKINEYNSKHSFYKPILCTPLSLIEV